MDETKEMLKALMRAVESLNAKIDGMDTKFEAKFDAMDGRMSAMDAKIDGMDAKFEARFDAMDTRMDAMDAKMDTMDAKFEARFDELNTRVIIGVEEVKTEVRKMRRHLSSVENDLDATISRVEKIERH